MNTAGGGNAPQKKAYALLAAAWLTAGCASYPDARLALPTAVPEAGPAPSTLSVMTYNLEGLAWPARSRRKTHLEAIAAEFARLERIGALPDVVVLQEAFSSSALRTASSVPHPFLAIGPRARTRSGLPKTTDPVLRKRNILRGEWGIRFMGSGLVIASRYPITAIYSKPYGPTSCAGWDCLANKGIMLVRIALPGISDPVEIATTHMNSQGASKAPPEKHLAAHNVQSEELANFLDQFSLSANPMVLAGDFNMRSNPARLDAFESQNGYQLARRYCLEVQDDTAAPSCDIRLSFDGDEPWLDTQDLQIYDNGARIALRPVRIEAWFDGPDAGGKLSDHDAYIVTYAIEQIPER